MISLDLISLSNDFAYFGLKVPGSNTFLRGGYFCQFCIKLRFRLLINYGLRVKTKDQQVNIRMHALCLYLRNSNAEMLEMKGVSFLGKWSFVSHRIPLMLSSWELREKWQKPQILTKTADFVENCGFWGKPQILTKTTDFVENCAFWWKSVHFDENHRFWWKPRIFMKTAYEVIFVLFTQLTPFKTIWGKEVKWSWKESIGYTMEKPGHMVLKGVIWVHNDKIGANGLERSQ